jgi:hypothetical protein
LDTGKLADISDLKTGVSWVNTKSFISRLPVNRSNHKRNSEKDAGEG